MAFVRLRYWALAAAVVAGCGPGRGEEPWSAREFVIYGAQDDGHAYLVRPGGPRVEIPIESIDLTQWTTDGAWLLVVDADRTLWAWSGVEDDAPQKLVDFVRSPLRLVSAPDPRFISVLTEPQPLDVRVEIIDLDTLQVIDSLASCTTPVYHAWLGDGPDYMAALGRCDDEGATTGFDLVATGSEGARVLRNLPADASRFNLSTAPDGQLVLLEQSDEWELLSPQTGEILYEQTSEHFATHFGWTGDSAVFMRYETANFDSRLLAYRRDGTLLWEEAGGVSPPTSLRRSKTDDRFMLIAEHHPGTVVYVVDPREGYLHGLGDHGEHTDAVFTPDPNMVAMARSNGRDQMLLRDLAAREELLIGTAQDWPPSWTPDFGTLSFLQPCEENDLDRLVVLEPSGTTRFVRECADFGSTRWSPDSDLLLVGIDLGTEDLPRPRAQVYDRDGNMLDLGPGFPGSWRPDP